MAPEQRQKRDVVGVLVVVPVAPRRLAGVPQIGRVAVDQLRAVEVERLEEAVAAAVHQLDRPGAGKPGSAAPSRSMPMLRSAGGLRRMIAPEPRWVSI